MKWDLIMLYILSAAVGLVSGSFSVTNRDSFSIADCFSRWLLLKMLLLYMTLIMIN